MSEIKANRKKIIVIIAVAMVAVVGAFLLIPRASAEKSKTKVITKSKEVTTMVLSEMLEPASKLTTLEYHYTDAEMFENSKKVFGKKVPFTTDKVIFKYSGVISSGIDLSQLTFEIDNKEKLIKITLPEIQIFSNEIDENSFEFFDVKNSVFTETKLEDYTELMGKLKEEKSSQLMENDEYKQEILINTKNVITSFMSGMDITKDFTIVFDGEENEAEDSAEKTE